MITIQTEEERSYKVVEEITEKAFYQSIYIGVCGTLSGPTMCDYDFASRTGLCD